MITTAALGTAGSLGCLLGLHAVSRRGDGHVSLAKKRESVSKIQAVKWTDVGDALSKSQACGDPDVVLAAVQRDGCSLQYADATVRAMKNIVLAAVMDRGAALEFAESFKDDEEVVHTALQRHGVALAFASDRLKRDRETVLIAVRQNGAALAEADPSLRADREVVLEAIRESGLAIQYAAESLQTSRRIAIEAVTRHPPALQYIPAACHEYREVVRSAVLQEPGVLAMAKDGLDQDPKLLRLADGVAPQLYASPQSDLDKIGTPRLTSFGAGGVPQGRLMVLSARPGLGGVRNSEFAGIVVAKLSALDAFRHFRVYDPNAEERMFCGAERVADQLRVLHAGDSEKCNGVYYRDGDFKGHPRLRNASNAIMFFDGMWKLRLAKESGAWQYQRDCLDLTPPTGQWTAAGGGAPCEVRKVWACRGDCRVICKLGRSCTRRPRCGVGPAPTRHSCYRYAHRWHQELACRSGGFMLQILERDKGTTHVFAHGDVQRTDDQELEEEMAKDLGLKIFRLTMPDGWGPKDRRQVDSLIDQLEKDVQIWLAEQQ